MTSILTLDFGGFTVKGGLRNPDGGIIGEDFSVATGKRSVADIIGDIRTRIGGENLPSFFAGACTGVIVNNKLQASTMLPQFKGVDFSTFLDIPGVAINDVNAHALAEKMHPEMTEDERQHFMMIAFGAGIGGGIVTHGRLIEGKTGCGGEFGQTFTPFKNPLKDGYLKLEEVIGTDPLVQYYQTLAGDQGLKLPKIDGVKTIEEHALNKRSSPRRSVARQVQKRVIELLGLLIYNVENITNPGAVILGGGGAGNPEWLLRPLGAHLVELFGRKSAIPHVGNPPKILLASQGPNAAKAGAFLHAKKYFDF